MPAKRATIDEYLAALSPDRRAALEKLRKDIRAAAPKAEDCIAYQVPAFRFEGRLLVAFGAAINHCSLYPMSSRAAKACGLEAQGYEMSKGTIRFPIGKPLPAALVRKIVKFRIEENRAKRR